MLYSKIEGSGRPLIILHGFLGMSDNWKTLGSQYAEAGFEVHIPDLRNHGRSFHSDVFTYEAMVEDITSYCTFHKLTEVCVIGHSMGGKIAMQLATDFPQLVQKLVVADISPRYYNPHHQDIFNALNSVDFSKKPSRQDVEETLKPLISDFGTRQFLMKSLYWKDPGQLAFRFNLEVFNKEYDAIGKALASDKVFEGPALFVRGEKSGYISDIDYPIISHHFPQAKIVTIKNAGHWLHAENPADFYSETIAFLK